MSQTLTSLPSALPLYVAAAKSARRKPQGKPDIPSLSAAVKSVKVNAKNLADYNKICGFEGGEFLPLTYPQVMVASLQMYLMTQPQFPLPLLGIVHVRQQIQVMRPMRADEVFDVEIRTGDSRDVRAGLEF